jgi:hypothetical protein
MSLLALALGLGFFSEGRMGGYGSSRWNWHRTRLVTDGLLVQDLLTKG